MIPWTKTIVNFPYYFSNFFFCLLISLLSTIIYHLLTLQRSSITGVSQSGHLDWVRVRFRLRSDQCSLSYKVQMTLLSITNSPSTEVSLHISYLSTTDSKCSDLSWTGVRHPRNIHRIYRCKHLRKLRRCCNTCNKVLFSHLLHFRWSSTFFSEPRRQYPNMPPNIKQWHMDIESVIGSMGLVSWHSELSEWGRKSDIMRVSNSSTLNNRV